MPNATPVVMDSEKSKLAAHAIKKRLEELNVPIKLNHAYEALAIAHRHPNWATMKAAIAEPQTKTTSAAFILGRRAQDDDRRIIELSHEDALTHIHYFATDRHSRRDFLENFGKNALRQGASAIFIEPVFDEESRSTMLNFLMSEATANGRRRDFYVLDLSSGTSRLGNSCNILEDEDDPSACANMFISELYSGEWPDAHLFISHCAGNILQRGLVLDVEGLALELRTLDGNGIPGEWVVQHGESFRVRTLGLGARLAVHVERFAERHKRFFDKDSPWMGLSSVFEIPQILIIFVSANPGELEAALQKLAFKAIRKAMVPRKNSVPHMLLLNDVDLLGKTREVAQAATTARISIALADQCPTPPSQFDGAAVELRGVALSHYLLEDGAETWMFAGPPRRG